MTDSTKENVPAKAPKEKKRTEVDQNKGTLSIPRPVKPSAPPRIPPARFYGKFTDLMNQVADLLSGHLKYPPFPQRFMVYKPGFGGDLILEVGDKQIVTIVDKAYVVKCIVKYTREHMLCEDAFTWTHRQCGECFDFWASATHEHKEEIPAFRWKDEPGLTFHRLPWDKPKAPYDLSLDRAPLFQEMMNRISNRNALMAWIGSLFDSTSASQQYIWMVGKGGDGKGSLISFLQHVFAEVFAKERPPKDENRFWTKGILKKRVVAFEDCNDRKFITSGLFKALTGGESERVEDKGAGSGYTANFMAKYIFTSNEDPEIKDTEADLRRLIFCPIEPRPTKKRNAKYKKQLVEEGEAFLEVCVGLYSAIPEGEDIPIIEDEALALVIDDSEEEFEAIFTANFHHYPGKTLSPTVFRNICKSLFFNSDNQLKGFKDYIARKYGIKKKYKDRGYLYMNIQVKEYGMQ